MLHGDNPSLGYRPLARDTRPIFTFGWPCKTGQSRYIMCLILIVPFHSASALVITPFAIRSVWDDRVQPCRQCLTALNTVVHMAPVIAPSSKSARTRITSPVVFRSSIACMNGTVSLVSLLVSFLSPDPTEYRSMVRDGSFGGTCALLEATDNESSVCRVAVPSVTTTHPLFPRLPRSPI